MTSGKLNTAEEFVVLAGLSTNRLTRFPNVKISAQHTLNML